MTVHAVVCGGKPPPLSDRYAKKYCFKATGSVRVIRTGKTTTSVVAYDKMPDVADIVRRLCTERALLDDGLEATDVVMTMYDECPTECEVTVIEYSDNDV